MDKHKYIRTRKISNPLPVRQPFNVQNPNMSIFDIHYINSGNDPAFWEDYTPYEHRHSFYEIHVFLAGEQDYFIDGKTYQLSSGGILLIPPGMLHSIVHNSPDFRKYALSISVSKVKGDPYEWIWERLDSPVLLKDAHYQKNLMSMIFDEAEQRKKGYLQTIENLLSVFIISIAQENAVLEEDESRLSESKLRVMQVKQYIKDNIDQHLDESTLATHVHISARQLNRNIIAETGMSVKELIDRIRYERACKLLQTSVSQSELIIQLGFGDVSSFNRFFKRMSNGITPRQWQQMNQQFDS